MSPISGSEFRPDDHQNSISTSSVRGRPGRPGTNRPRCPCCSRIVDSAMSTSPRITVAAQDPQLPSRHECGTAIPAASMVSTDRGCAANAMYIWPSKRDVLRRRHHRHRLGSIWQRSWASFWVFAGGCRAGRSGGRGNDCGVPGERETTAPGARRLSTLLIVSPLIVHSQPPLTSSLSGGFAGLYALLKAALAGPHRPGIRGRPDVGAPGITTATPALAATSSVDYCYSFSDELQQGGRGPRSTPPRPRFSSYLHGGSPTDSICGAASRSTPGSPPRPSMSRRCVGSSPPTPARSSGRASASWPPVRCRRP